MRSLLQPLQILGSILSTKMTGDSARQTWLIFYLLLFLTVIASTLQYWEKGL